MIRLVLFLIALTTGAGAAALAIHMRPPPPTPIYQETSVAPATQDVLVASVELAPTQALTGDNMRWQAWPESALNPIYITRSRRPDAAETLAGTMVRNRMSIGEPIREANLASRHVGFLAAILPAGKRAIAVKISAENTAGGFILPNDRVDVLYTEGQQHVSRTILWNIPVLAIDQIVDEKSKDDKGKATVIGKTSTLELDPQQAEILTAAQAKGSVSLALRSAADKDDDSKPANPIIRMIRAGRSELLFGQ